MATMAAYFSPKSFTFLRGLARHNEREWFHAHKADYEAHVRGPFLALLGDLQPALAAISPHYRADPRPMGGSLFRIHRDTRFASDKSPYKGWQGARLFHHRRREVAAPSFYIHLEPGASFVWAGLWHPETPTQRKVRQFIYENPGSWSAAAHASAFRRRFELGSEGMLVRTPPGFAADFAYVEDLRRRNFVAVRALDDAAMASPRLRGAIEKDLQSLAPFVDYLCASLDLEF